MVNISRRRGGGPSQATALQTFRVAWLIVLLIVGGALLIVKSRLGDDMQPFRPSATTDAERAVRRDATAAADASKAAAAAPGTDSASSPSDKAAGTYYGQLRTEGSKHATVMAMASGYGLNVYRNYVGSLRNSGFEGHIILGVKSPLEPGVEKYFKEQRVTAKYLKLVDCTFEPLHKPDEGKELNSHQKEQNTCAYPYSDIKVRWSRFPLLRDWLEECKECTGPVLVSDARDALFQRDPFGVGAPEVTGLQVFQEHHTQLTNHWIVKNPVERCKGINFAEPPLLSPMLCSGTTIGTRDAMLKYLTAMYEEMKVWTKDPNCCCNPMNGDDQSIHNYLYYTGKLPFAIAVPNRMGIVNTAGVQGSSILEGHANMWKKEGVERPKAMREKTYQGAENNRWIGKEFDLTDDQGFFTDLNGERSRVVHQYDRFGLPFTIYLTKTKNHPLKKHLEN